jgi:hypothetical protein
LAASFGLLLRKFLHLSRLWPLGQVDEAQAHSCVRAYAQELLRAEQQVFGLMKLLFSTLLKKTAMIRLI